MKYDETWVTNWLETRSRPWSTVHKSYKMQALVCQSERYIIAPVRLLLRFLHLSSTGQTGSEERVGFLDTRARDEEFYAEKRGRTYIHQCCVEWSKSVWSVMFRGKKISAIFKNAGCKCLILTLDRLWELHTSYMWEPNQPVIIAHASVIKKTIFLQHAFYTFFIPD